MKTGVIGYGATGQPANHPFEVAPRKWTKAASFQARLMKQLKSSVTESGVPVASVAAAAGPWLPTQVRAALATASGRAGQATAFRSFPVVSGDFRSLFKKIMKPGSCARPSARPTCRQDGASRTGRRSRSLRQGYGATGRRSGMQSLGIQGSSCFVRLCQKLEFFKSTSVRPPARKRKTMRKRMIANLRKGQ